MSFRALTLWPESSFPDRCLAGLPWGSTSATVNNLSSPGHSDASSAQAFDYVVHTGSKALHLFVHPETSKTSLKAQLESHFFGKPLLIPLPYGVWVTSHCTLSWKGPAWPLSGLFIYVPAIFLHLPACTQIMRLLRKGNVFIFLFPRA